MAILILGYGYIGAALARTLRSAGERVVALDDFFSTPEPLAMAAAARDGVELISGDITATPDLDRAFRRAGERPRVVLLAAQPSADPASAPPELTEKVNLTGPRLVFEACERHGAAQLLSGSSMRVYGRYPTGCVSESSPYGVAPDLPHLTKIYTEQLFTMLAPRAAFPIVSARLGLVYGVGPIMKTDPRFMTAPNRFCLDAVRGRPIALRPGTGRPDNLIHVEDVADALRLTLDTPFSPGHSALNVVASTISIRRIAALVVDLAAERGYRVEIDDQSGGDAPDSVEFVSRLVELGWAPRQSLARAIAETIDYFVRLAA